MISVQCPHCHVGLKVDEAKLPPDITFFPCPKCKQHISISFLSHKEKADELLAPETALIRSVKKNAGRITVLPDANTPEQVFKLTEGHAVVGRKSAISKAMIAIETSDRSMSREHIRLEIKKDVKGGYIHYLSDNNSKNYTLYNSSYLKNGEVVILKDNDEIVLGRTILRFNE